MNKLLLIFVLSFYNCNISHADKYQYWDELSDTSKSEIIKSLNIDKNIMMLYLHQITLSDNDMSTVILDSLCTPTDDNERMFYFYIMNEVVKCADGAFAEMLGSYCIKFINKNADYALEYFNKHHDIANDYSVLIATELYLNDISIINYKQQILHSGKVKTNRKYLLFFLDNIEHNLNSLIEK